MDEYKIIKDQKLKLINKNDDENHELKYQIKILFNQQ